MSAPKPLEEQILAPAARLIAADPSSRLDVLEGVSSLLGGYSLSEYRKRFPNDFACSTKQSLRVAEAVLREMKNCGIPAPTVLASLARPSLSTTDRRRAGIYYTDFRLASHLVASVRKHLVPGAKVVDPASGTGTLLVAATLLISGSDKRRTAKWLAESVVAADSSREALRGAQLALASMVSDLSAVQHMASHWRCGDSLVGDSFTDRSFDVVLGNPPWEKIKVSRHEFLQSKGQERHYGADYVSLDAQQLNSQRAEAARYGSLLSDRYTMLGGGDTDLYIAFLELMLRVVRPSGCVSVLVPAGLIRSEGTAALRRFLFDSSRGLSFTVMENRARYFAIDTRFKFLNLALTRAGKGGSRERVIVKHATGTDVGITTTGIARINRRDLIAVRPDLSVPEVRTDGEWEVFRRISERGVIPDSTSPWRMEIVRELDMTRDRPNFLSSPGTSRLPLVEGRMVHQHWFGAKSYCSGTGRRAKWTQARAGRLRPQYWFPDSRLPGAIAKRISRSRAGFCDITGQTNERSMLAALIPQGVVCGNKVPTVTFPNDQSDERLFLWVAVSNSVSFDWFLRRILTTTVNYFLLRSVPLPRVEPSSPQGLFLVHAAQDVSALRSGAMSSSDLWRMAELRASIDVAVHACYGLEFDDLVLMLNDFPLLDRGQPPLPGEKKSTITRDLILSHAAQSFAKPTVPYNDRVKVGRALGAVPYVPSEFCLAPTKPNQPKDAAVLWELSQPV